MGRIPGLRKRERLSRSTRILEDAEDIPSSGELDVAHGTTLNKILSANTVFYGLSQQKETKEAVEGELVEVERGCVCGDERFGSSQTADSDAAPRSPAFRGNFNFTLIILSHTHDDRGKNSKNIQDA